MIAKDDPESPPLLQEGSLLFPDEGPTLPPGAGLLQLFFCPTLETGGWVGGGYAAKG